MSKLGHGRAVSNDWPIHAGGWVCTLPKDNRAARAIHEFCYEAYISRGSRLQSSLPQLSCTQDALRGTRVLALYARLRIELHLRFCS
jgi:hypothetical protein